MVASDQIRSEDSLGLFRDILVFVFCEFPVDGVEFPAVGAFNDFRYFLA